MYLQLYCIRNIKLDIIFTFHKQVLIVNKPLALHFQES